MSNRHCYNEKISFAYDRPHHFPAGVHRMIRGYFDNQARFIGLMPAWLLVGHSV